MRNVLPLTASLLILCLPAAAQEGRRELGAHEHGRGTLNIAIEGKRVSMELEVPGMDIVGFEHAAQTSAQKNIVRGAKSTLSKPLALFKLPGSAGCRVQEAKVLLEGEDQDHDHADNKQGKRAKVQSKKDKGAGEAQAEHNEFRAEYVLECATPSAVKSIEFDYFKAFKGAERLDVNVITPKGQTKFEVSRDKPRLDLAGLV